jgi:predicted nucleic-acid-binding Zn-ribbon protein
MAQNNQAVEITIKDKKLECPICGHNKFYTRKSLLNTRGLTFFNLDWANKYAMNHICENCGYIYWFYNQ